jgi:hypothetical protein
MKMEICLLNTLSTVTTSMNRFLLGGLVLLGLNLGAQSPNSLMIEYTDEDVVRLENYSETVLSIDDDEILITNRIKLMTFINDKELNGRGEISLKYEPPFSEITDIDAYTLVPNLERDKYSKNRVRDIVDRKLIDEDVFHNGTRAKSFSFEGLTKGAITVLEYEEEYHEPFLVGREIFDPYVYSKSQVFMLVVEEGIEIEYDYFNCDSSFFEHSIEKKRGETIHRWSTKEMESRKYESGAPDRLYLSPHIVYRIKSFRKSDGTVEKVLGDVNDLHRYYQTFLDGLEAPNEELIGITDSLVKGLSSDRAKAKAIYDWVNHSIRYIAFEDGYGGFRPREANFVCTKRYGDCKDMGNLMVQMMNHAGLEAYHVWIGTRSIPYTYEQVPTGLSDNHMIAAVKLNDEYYFLDATNKFLPFPYPSSFTQGKQALINLGPDDFKLKMVPTLKAEQNHETDTCRFTLEEGSLIGKGRKDYGIYHRSSVMRVLERKDEDALESFIKYDLEKGDNRCKSELVDYQDHDTSLTFNYTTKLNQYARETGDKLILNMNLEQLLASGKLEDDRENALELKNATLFKRYFELEIPENYTVSHLPEGSSFEHPKFGFEISYRQEGNIVIYEMEIALKALFVEKEELEDWNNFIRALRKEYQQTLILNQQ